MGNNPNPPILVLMVPPKADLSSFIPYSHLRDLVDRQLNPLLAQMRATDQQNAANQNYPVKILESGDNFRLQPTDYFVHFNGNGVTFTAYLPLAKDVSALVLRVGPSCGVTLKRSPNGTDTINESATSLSLSSSTTYLLFSDGKMGWYSK